MTWISHVGRTSGVVEATATAVRGLLDDVHAASGLVRGHLDVANSRLDQEPPVWALDPIGVMGVGARPAVAVTMEHAPTGILLRSTPVQGFDPTRLTADIDLLAEGDACRLVARWDAAVDLPVPKLARRPGGQVVGRILHRLVDSLFAELRAAAA